LSKSKVKNSYSQQGSLNPQFWQMASFDPANAPIGKLQTGQGWVGLN
jgi:hypothetical protein